MEYVEEPDIGLADDDSKYFKLMEKIDKDSYTRNTSVGIASAITAYARIAMYDYIADEGVVYSDTDSIFTTKELPEHMVGKELGQMKLEYQFDAALFVRSKIYYTVKDGVYKVVFKGVKRGLATQDDVNKLYLGSSVTFYNNNLRKIPGGGLKEESVKYTVTPPDGSKRSMVRDEEGN